MFSVGAIFCNKQIDQPRRQPYLESETDRVSHKCRFHEVKKSENQAALWETFGDKEMVPEIVWIVQPLSCFKDWETLEPMETL